MKPNRVIFSYLVKVIEYFESGGKVRGALNKVSEVKGSAYTALFRYINDVAGTVKYNDLAGTNYPISPNEYLIKIYELYFLEGGK